MRMATLIPFLLVATGSFLQAQEPQEYINPIIRAMESSARAKQAAAELEVKQRDLELRRQIEEKDLELRRQQLQVATGGASQLSEDQIKAALVELFQRFPDLSGYLPEMDRLSPIFRLGDQKSLREYLEGLYVVAKFASFSSLAKRPDPQGLKLTNADIVGLVKAGLQEETIVAKINASTNDFVLDPSDLIVLKASQVNDIIIRAMIGASSRR